MKPLSFLQKNRVDLSSISEVSNYITEWLRFFGPPCMLRIFDDSVFSGGALSLSRFFKCEKFTSLGYRPTCSRRQQRRQQRFAYCPRKRPSENTTGSSACGCKFGRMTTVRYNRELHHASTLESQSQHHQREN